MSEADDSIKRLKELYDSACHISAQRADEIRRLNERIRNMELAQAEVDKVFANIKAENECNRLNKECNLLNSECNRLSQEVGVLKSKLKVALSALRSTQDFLYARDSTFAAANLADVKPCPLTKLVQGAINEIGDEPWKP
jgi:archaellum component FlaC